jgi:bacillithiol system protein YtxJ
MFPWNSLTDLSQIDEIVKKSFNKTQLVFKHSTRCSISRTALSKFERNFDNDNKSMDLFYLDLLENRLISNKIAEQFNIEHQSPQVLVIKNGNCVFTATHNVIDADEVIAFQ